MFDTLHTLAHIITSYKLRSKPSSSQNIYVVQLHYTPEPINVLRSVVVNLHQHDNKTYILYIFIHQPNHPYRTSFESSHITTTLCRPLYSVESTILYINFVCTILHCICIVYTLTPSWLKTIIFKNPISQENCNPIKNNKTKCTTLYDKIYTVLGYMKLKISVLSCPFPPIPTHYYHRHHCRQWQR